MTTVVKKRTPQIGDCTVKDCTKPKYSNNLCRLHNNRMSRTGKTDLGPRVPWNKSGIEVCVMDDCTKKYIAKGFCSRHYRAFKAWMDKDRSVLNRAKNNPTKDQYGYVIVYVPNHPNCSVSGQYPEHRLVMEEMIGRYLTREENVHHKNGVRNDNRPANLELWSSSQPKGQRAEDKVKFAIEILELYAPHLLTEVLA